MALQIEKTTPQGMTLNYWIIDPNIAVEWDTPTIYARIKGYASSAAYDSGKQSVEISGIEGINEVMSFTMAGADATTALNTGDPRPSLYTYLLTTTFFNGATEV